MADDDHQIGDTVVDPQGNYHKLSQTDNGPAWRPVEAPVIRPGMASGIGKAIGTGILHEGIAGLVGLPGTLGDLKNKAGAWMVNKELGLSPATDNPDAVSGAAPHKGDYFTPEDYAKLAGNGPLSLPDMPTTEEVRKGISKVIPDYEPKNWLESSLKTGASFLPSLITAPETGGASLLQTIGRGGANVTRYAVAPGFASEGAKRGVDAVGQGQNPYVSIPAQILATVLSQGVASKIISPNSADAARRAARETLTDAGATFSPKQGAGSVSKPGDLYKEGQQLGIFGKGPVAAENATNQANFTRGTLRTAYGDTLPPGPVRDEVMNATSINPGLRNRVNQTIDGEFNRLTGQYTMPLDQSFQNDLGRIVSHYKQEAILRQNPQLDQDANRLLALAQIQNQPGLAAGHITGRQYQNMRSQLSSLAVSESDTSMARALRGIRDSLDGTMERAIRYQNPQDLGAFNNVRRAYENNLIVGNAMNRPGMAVSGYTLNPIELSQATHAVLGPEAYGSAQHPMARLAHAGEQIIRPIPLPDPTGTLGHVGLASVLGFGTGHLGGHLLDAGGSSGGLVNYMAGAGAMAAPLAGRPMVRALMGTDWGRRYLSNQVLPLEAKRGLLRDPSTVIDAAIMAEALYRKQQQETKPPQ